ncbi:ATP-binding protein [Vibrio parahaemolyticus]|uniref:ATP-binding protein n=1 Tax=Vibrio parahaemolyticus TaxID=670 RepID=UPI00226B428A|nr:ATP-binding protein [Vibrio parahaemolyticus]MCX8843567.1 ATP-binding protein [Vibrio parahaemolyticus]
MKSIGHFIYSFSNELEAYLVASYCKMYALELGLSEYQAGLFNAAVSEITINAIRYASGGHAFISSTANNLGIEVIIEDHGQGITNLPEALMDGFSTFKDQSLGLGLGVARRCSDEMIINKSDETGTSITLRKFLPVSEEDILVRAISFPASNHINNGNAYVVKQYHGDTCLIALIDSHDSSSASERGRMIANRLAETVENHMCDSLGVILERCQNVFNEEPTVNGVLKISLLRVCSNYLDYLTLNTPPLHWLNYDERQSTNKSSPHTIEITSNEMGVTRVHRPNNFTCLLHSSGVNYEQQPNHKWDSGDAYTIATTIFNDCAYEDKDATVIVIRGIRHD